MNPPGSFLLTGKIDFERKKVGRILVVFVFPGSFAFLWLIPGCSNASWCDRTIRRNTISRSVNRGRKAAKSQTLIPGLTPSGTLCHNSKLSNGEGKEVQ
jgi:hypothetical protein